MKCFLSIQPNTIADTSTMNATINIGKTAQKATGTRLNISSVQRPAPQEIPNFPDWAEEAMRQGKQIVQRDGQFYIAQHDNDHDEKDFHTALATAIEEYQEDNQLSTTQIWHLADGTTFTDPSKLKKYTTAERKALREATQEAVSMKKMRLAWREEDQMPNEKSGLTEQMRNYIDDAYDYDFYARLTKELRSGWADEGRLTEDEGVNQKDAIFLLVGEWIKEQGHKSSINWGKYGGDWNCGENSGVWADFLIAIKSNPDFKGHQPKKGEYYIGVRLHATEVVKPLTAHIPLTEPWRPIFTIISTTLLYEPQSFGLTTVCMPNYGKPYYPRIVSHFAKKWKEEAKAEREAEKLLAHKAFIAEQRQKEAEMKAKREADEMERVLAETIKAYNEKATKDLIAFNRTHIAEPLRKRIEAKEREREAEEAERRHAEKLKQKEIERQMKYARKH